MVTLLMGSTAEHVCEGGAALSTGWPIRSHLIVSDALSPVCHKTGDI